MKMKTVIIGSMKGEVVDIGIIIEEHLLHLNEGEEERGAMKDTMKNIITDPEIITNQSTMRMSIITPKEKKILGKAIIIASILVHCLLHDLVQDIISTLQSIQIFQKEKR